MAALAVRECGPKWKVESLLSSTEERDAEVSITDDVEEVAKKESKSAKASRTLVPGEGVSASSFSSSLSSSLSSSSWRKVDENDVETEDELEGTGGKVSDGENVEGYAMNSLEGAGKEGNEAVSEIKETDAEGRDGESADDEATTCFESTAEEGNDDAMTCVKGTAGERNAEGSLFPGTAGGEENDDDDDVLVVVVVVLVVI